MTEQNNEGEIIDNRNALQSVTAENVGLVFYAMKVKRLQVNEWCPVCKRPTSCSYTLLGAVTNDPEAQAAPEMCHCAFWQPHVPALTILAPASTTTYTLVDVVSYEALQAEHAHLKAENERLQREHAELLKTVEDERPDIVTMTEAEFTRHIGVALRQSHPKEE